MAKQSKSNGKEHIKKFVQPTEAQPVATVPVGEATPSDAAKASVLETDEARQARVNRAGEAIRKVLESENVIMTVPALDISTGRVFARIELFAKPIPANIPAS